MATKKNKRVEVISPENKSFIWNFSFSNFGNDITVTLNN